MPMRHLTVTGTAIAAFMAATQSPTSARLGHQAGAEAALLHAVRRTADIEIDLVVAEVCGDAGALRERCRVGAAKLQRHRMLGRIEGDEPRAIAMQHRPGGDHLGVDQRPARQQAMEEPAVPVRPFHHRCDREAARESAGVWRHDASI